MSTSPYKTTIQNRHARFAQGNRSLRQIFAVSLILAVLAVLQTVRADFVLLNNSFDNSTNNMLVNDLGIGGGFSSYSSSYGLDSYIEDAFEANGHAVIATSLVGNRAASIASLDTFNLNGGGTLFEFKGVNFSTNTPGQNGGLGSNDRLMVGVSDVAPAGGWFTNGVAGLPDGFWIQLNSDSIVTGTGSGAWSGTSTLFYKSRAGTVTQLTSWVFDTLKWSPSGPNVYTPTLDIKLTMTGTGWALTITGDTVGGVTLNRTGTFAAAGVKNQLADGLTQTYMNVYNQTERPGIAMTIDQVLVSQVGNLSVTTPTFSTPDEPVTTNGVLAGETTILTSIVTSTGSPTFQWQLEDSSNLGTFTNIVGATATNVSIDTTNLGDSTPRGVRLIGTLSGNSVTSSVVTLTVFPASAPVIVQDIDPAGTFSLYNGAGATISASFRGNKPIYYQWLHAGSDNVFTNLPGETNNTHTIASASSKDAGSYYLVATNAVGTTLSSQTVVQITPGTPRILWWNPAFKYGALNADQILASFPSTNKLAGAMVAQNGGSPIIVTNTGGAQIAFAPNNSWASVAHFTGYGTGANTNNTGNANFNKVLNTFVYDNTNHTLTLNGLVVGKTYQVQLFGLDDRTGNTKRGQNWQDPQDSTDISVTYGMGANAYLLGTFTATATSQTIQQNVPTNGLGNFNAVVLRTVGWNPPPYFTLQPKSLGYFTGDNATLTGAAAGDMTIASPAITYQWKSGPAGGPYTSLTEGPKFNGTTTTTLTITNLAVVDDVNVVYVLAASNGAGTQNSAEVHLGVQQTPSAPTPGSYAAVALSYGPTALWMLNENLDPSLGNVKAYDYSGNNYRAQYGTTAKDGFNSIAGPQPTAFPGFDASEAALQPTTNDINSVVAVPPLNHTNIATTIVMWINPTDNGYFAKGLFYNRNPALPGQIGGLGYYQGSGNLGYNWNDVGGTYNYNSGLSPKQNQWNMVALVIETNQATFYLDYVDSVTTANVLLQAINPAPNASVLTFNGGNTYIGLDSYGASRTFNGKIAGVGLYNKALTQPQILSLFGAGVGVSGGFPPSIATQPPATKNAYPGQTITLTAGGVGGTVPITYQWQSNNVNLVEGGQFSGTHTNSLTITGVTTGNNATYNLVLQNSVGTSTSSNSVLNVDPVPTLTKIQVGPNQLALSWPFGTLLESTNLMGPWTTNHAASPFTNKVFPDAQHYYRVRNP